MSAEGDDEPSVTLNAGWAVSELQPGVTLTPETMEMCPPELSFLTSACGLGSQAQY